MGTAIVLTFRFRKTTTYCGFFCYSIKKLFSLLLRCDEWALLRTPVDFETKEKVDRYGRTYWDSKYRLHEQVELVNSVLILEIFAEKLPIIIL